MKKTGNVQKKYEIMKSEKIARKNQKNVEMREVEGYIFLYSNKPLRKGSLFKKLYCKDKTIYKMTFGL